VVMGQFPLWLAHGNRGSPVACDLPLNPCDFAPKWDRISAADKIRLA